MNRIEQIKKRLDECTPGEWIFCGWDPMEPPHLWVKTVAENNGVCDSRSNLSERADGELMAHAPSDLRYLLSRLESAERVVEAARRRQEYADCVDIVIDDEGREWNKEYDRRSRSLDAALAKYDGKVMGEK